ncbi:hypothetical protein C8A05DRAFT_45396 [Staphylotrichum tortipilum]|uniref:Uncharacterized protein n=1 Tax=Staphylotrichum tortipilum TaxID=2831512 RepID=A0AAN6RSU3_9PEZI|nr:hypothetical protein C8A05DRAFT_45396 [Staphylotrichum longicolle]
MCVKSLAGTLDAEIGDSETEEECWAEFGQMVPGDVSATPEEVKALREFVEAYRTENPIPAAEAARSLMSLDEDRIPCEGDDESNDKGERIALLLWDVATVIPHHQPALLAIIDAVMAMPRLEATPEQERRLGPMLGCWVHRYPSKAYGGGFGSPGLVRANAFAAHRLAMHPPKVTRSDELNSALQIIVYALELDPWNHTNVHALVPFIDIAGDVIYEWTDGRTQLRKFNPGGHPKGSVEYRHAQLPCIKGRHPEADLWDTDERVTRERWGFWKARLVWVSSQGELMQRTRDEATTVVRMMEDIERRAAQPSQSAV